MPKKPSVENRSTIRQLYKILYLLDAQRRRKCLSIILFLDLVNAFNAMNHSAIFYILRLCGYLDEDIALLIRLYDRTFFFIGNHFSAEARLKELILAPMSQI
jgi:hypothetical protein